MKSNLKVSLLILLIISVYACSSKQSQTKKYFRITSNITANTELRKPNTLVVKKPTALSILGGRPMVATKDDQSLIQLNNNYWLESPKVLLHYIIKNWAGEHWESVSIQTPHRQDHQVLYTRILAFEKNQNSTNVALEFSLYDQENALIFNQNYEHAEPIDGEGYRAFAKAVGRSVDSILNQLASDL